MRRIVILDDVFRSSINGLQTHTLNARFLLAQARTALHALGRTDLEALYVGGTDAADLQVDVAGLMAALDLTPGLDSWYALQGRASTPEFEAAVTRALGTPALVMGFEIPNPLFLALTALDVPVVDLSVSPLRFGPELYFDIRASDARLQSVCATYVAGTEALTASVGMIRTFTYTNMPAMAQLDTLGRIGVMAGQLLVDTALVTEDGTLFALGDALDEVGAWVQKHDTILYQRHPSAEGPDHLRTLAQFGVPVYETNWPTYALCASDQVRSVLAISSGMLEEAPWFDCAPTRLMTPLRRRLTPFATERVDARILSADAFAALLGDTPARGDHPGPVLRDVFGAWGALGRPPELVLTGPYIGDQAPPSSEKQRSAFKRRWRSFEKWLNRKLRIGQP